MNALAKREEAQGAVEQAGNAVLSMIERAARDPQVDIEKMRQLLQMRADEEARVAKREFNAAMAEVQAQTSAVATDANNPQTHSRYATYYALDKALRPIYTAHGFAVTWDTEPSGSPEVVRVVGYQSHRGGHTQRYQFDMPADGKGAKGGEVMSKTHAAGAASQYGMRYLLKMMWNIAIGESDDDGNAASAGPAISQEQLSELIAECDDVGADKKAFCQYLRIDALAHLPASRFKQAMDALAAKRKKS